MDAADLLPGEKVDVVDIDNGARLSTYVIEGAAGSGIIGVNGAAARLIQPGDLVIIIGYGQMTDQEARAFQPRVVFVDGENKIRALGSDPADVGPGSVLTRGDEVTAVPSSFA
jgi:aspartate 1-decarboxylase